MSENPYTGRCRLCGDFCDRNTGPAFADMVCEDGMMLRAIADAIQQPSHVDKP